jgi:hypothetical protein
MSTPSKVCIKLEYGTFSTSKNKRKSPVVGTKGQLVASTTLLSKTKNFSYYSAVARSFLLFLEGYSQFSRYADL